jgi:hypothetical protein
MSWLRGGGSGSAGSTETGFDSANAEKVNKLIDNIRTEMAVNTAQTLIDVKPWKSRD